MVGLRSTTRAFLLATALTFAVGLAARASSVDVGYGPDLFYYLRHDGTGFSTYGTISTSGAVTDRFGVGNNFDALTFAEDFNAPAVPEPGTLILFLTGLPILVGFRRARFGTGS